MFSLTGGELVIETTKEFKSQHFPPEAVTSTAYLLAKCSEDWEWKSKYLALLPTLFCKDPTRNLPRGLVHWMESNHDNKNVVQVFSDHLHQELNRLCNTKKDRKLSCQATYIGPHIHMLIHGNEGLSLKTDNVAVETEPTTVQMLTQTQNWLDKAVKSTHNDYKVMKALKANELKYAQQVKEGARYEREWRALKYGEQELRERLTEAEDEAIRLRKENRRLMQENMELKKK